MTNDMINGLFEVFGGLLLCLNCWKMFCDKQLKGVSWLPSLRVGDSGIYTTIRVLTNGLVSLVVA